jgi:hypothetical protein
MDSGPRSTAAESPQVGLRRDEARHLQEVLEQRLENLGV